MIEYDIFHYDKVSQKLNDGWELYGSPATAGTGRVVQAMTKGNASTVKADDYTSPVDSIVKRNVELVTENAKMREVLKGFSNLAYLGSDNFFQPFNELRQEAHNLTRAIMDASDG